MRRSLLLALPVLSLTWCIYAWGDVVEIDKFKSNTPSGWKATKPANKFRTYQFSVPKADGDPADAEVVVFFFGPGAGGGVDENVKRWQKMFIAPNSDSKVTSNVETFKVGKVEVTYLDVSGVYVSKNPPFDPKAKEEKFPNYRMLSVYFASENGPYFLRMTGPAKTVEQNKKGFDEWLKNFK